MATKERHDVLRARLEECGSYGTDSVCLTLEDGWALVKEADAMEADALDLIATLEALEREE